MTAFLLALEILGMALLVVCAYLIYPPAAFGLAGLLLILVANLRAVRTKPKGDE